MDIGLKGLAIGFFKELVPELIAEYWGVSTLKKILGKGKSAKESTDATEGKTPEIKYGGAFDLSDEMAYFGLIGRMGSDPMFVDHPKKISDFINTKLDKDWQKRRFRVIVGSLANVPVVIKTETIPIITPGSKGAPPTTKDKVIETKSNLGLEFLKNFGRHTPDEMLEICQASGILESKMEKALKIIEDENSALHTTLTSATRRMKVNMKMRKANSLIAQACAMTKTIAGLFRR